MKRSLLALLLIGCGSGFSAAPRGEVDGGSDAAVGTGGVRVALHGTGGVRGGSGGERSTGGQLGAGGAPGGAGGAFGSDAGSGGSSTGGLSSSGGAHSSGGVPATGGASGTGGALGSGGAGDVGVACLTDLSGVGTGDFRISFTLMTTESVLTLGLLNQRMGCNDTSTFWDISLSPTGGVVVVTNDGAHRAFVVAGNSLNDGKPHTVDVIRRGGKLWYASDGVIRSTPASDPYSFGTFPPLVFGSSACAGTTPAAGHATISDVCLTTP